MEPAAIEAVLKELQMYIRSGDHKFVCAAIRAVGKVVELSRIVYDRHGEKSGDVPKERKTANRIEFSFISLFSFDISPIMRVPPLKNITLCFSKSTSKDFNCTK